MRSVPVGSFSRWVQSSPSKESKEFRIAMTKAGFSYHWRRVSYDEDGAVESFTLGVITRVSGNVSQELQK